MKVKYINYGTGNRIRNTIYLNANLLKYPKLHDAILKHEKRHTSKYKRKDFFLDLRNKELGKVKKDWWAFLLRYPGAWLNFLPVMKLGNNWYIDIHLSVAWGLLLFMLFLIWHSI